MTLHANISPRRRGACPGLSAPMPTGDGLLVRLQPIGTVSLRAFVGLCAAARECGNGIIEITARGSIQVRGLSGASARHFAKAVGALNIAAADGVPVHTNALTGLDAEETLDAGEIAADLRRALAATSLAVRLAPKVSVAIDGGGALGLDALSADLRLRAEMNRGPRMVRISAGGDATNACDLGVVAPAQAVEAAVRLLGVLAQRGYDARARDILADDSGPFRVALADLVHNASAPKFSTPHEPIGAFRLRDGSLAGGIGLAFGHADESTLRQLIEAATAAGAAGVRTAHGRALMVVGLGEKKYSSFLAAAERLGFVVRADDPRRRVVACAGAPICASAYIAARAVAPLIAKSAAPFLDRSRTIHISGCAKGCAHPGPAALTAVGTPDGCAVVANGSPRDAPFATVAAHELPTVLAGYAEQMRGGGNA